MLWSISCLEEMYSPSSLLKQHEHQRFITSIGIDETGWIAYCYNNNVSAGKMYSIEGSGRGCCNIVISKKDALV